MESTYGWSVQIPTLLCFPSENSVHFTEPPSFEIVHDKEKMAPSAIASVETTSPLADRNVNMPNPKDTYINSSTSRIESATLKLESFQVDENHIQASPYPDPQNLLDLRGLSTSNRLFALALTFLEPVRSDYATAPYLDSFNWPVVFHMLRHFSRAANFEWQEQEFYVVIFRSILKPGIDRKRLGELDQNSHAEACESGGLLKYWFGKTDDQNRNLATCIWRNREDARLGGRGPWHALARAAAKEMYVKIDFSIHKLVVNDGANEWRLE
ncbi:MAG: hypothetical protein M1821_004527 [Bathelium mastoideum]|nr:MAG: hypothetical protein M1821_004527 [Bathelium mastoideum]